MDKSKINNWLVNFIIISLSVSPAFALADDNKNLLLIGAMAILIPFVFIISPPRISKIDLTLVSLCLFMVAFPLLGHPETMRWSTVLYSCMFCFYFMAFIRVVFDSTYNNENLYKLLKYLIYAYCIVLIIQQFCVLTGLPIFNISNYSIKEPWKLNSLMSEPSHSARIISVLMYLFVCCDEKQNKGEKLSLKESFRKAKWVWLAYLWCVFTMGSATAFIFMWIVFLKFVNLKRVLPTIAVALSVLAVLFYFSDNKNVVRAKKILIAALTLDEEKIMRADGSGGSRIVPTIQAAKVIGITSNSDWFGYGIDADKEIIKPLPGFTKGQAGAFYLWINFGAIVAIIWWLFSLKVCYIPNNYVSLFVWILVIFAYGGFNNQIVWMTLTLLYTYKSIQQNGIDS